MNDAILVTKHSSLEAHWLSVPRDHGSNPELEKIFQVFYYRNKIIICIANSTQELVGIYNL